MNLAFCLHAELLQFILPGGRARDASFVQEIAVIPWIPLTRGRLARPWDETSKRSQTDFLFDSLTSTMEETDREIAAKRHVPPAQIALAWVLQKSVVTAPIIGATQLQHFEDAVQALTLSLT